MVFDVGGGVVEGAEVKIGQPVFRIHIILIWIRIRIRDHGSGSEVSFNSVNRIFPIRH